MRWQGWPPQVLATLRRGAAIPAYPLALDAARKLDLRRQRALARYYLDAGVGGRAAGVHHPAARRCAHAPSRVNWFEASVCRTMQVGW